MKKWKTLSSELALDSKWFKVQKDVVELPTGRILNDYYFWKEPNVVWIVAVTEENDMLLVKQYKHGIGDIVLEYPGAIVEDGETPEECAKRELLEETGYTSETFELINTLITNPTKSSGRVWVFLAMNCRKVADQHLDSNEEIDIVRLKFPEVINHIKEGKITFVGTIAATMLVKDRLEK